MSEEINDGEIKKKKAIKFKYTKELVSYALRNGHTQTEIARICRKNT